MKYINPDNPIYISYAWANAAKPSLEDDVNKLCSLMEQKGLYYKRDKDSLCPYRWSIHEAEEEIGNGCAILVVISEKYIKSLHCMHEWHLIKENGKIWDRVFPIVLKDADLTNKTKYKEYYKFYNQRKQELVAQQSEGIIPLSHSETEAARYGYYLADLADMYQYLSDFNTAKNVIKENDYEIVISQLKKHIEAVLGQKFGQQNHVKTKNKDVANSKTDTKIKETKKESSKDSEIVYKGLTKHQTVLLQQNLNSTRNAFLKDKNNGEYAKQFLETFNYELPTDGRYDLKTKNAVVALQRYLNIKQLGLFEILNDDGEYGPITETAYDAWSKKANPNIDKKILDK